MHRLALRFRELPALVRQYFHAWVVMDPRASEIWPQPKTTLALGYWTRSFDRNRLVRLFNA
jgi:hypothetical protein